MQNVIILGTKGVPARHGAFEQFAHMFSKNFKSEYRITVYCEGGNRETYYDEVTRVFIPVLKLPFYPIIYDLLSIINCILFFKRRNTTIFIFGYTSSPFLGLFNLFGFKYWINTDGYEYRRDKFGSAAKLYLKFAERMAVFWAGNKLITDSSDLVNYFQKRYNVSPKFIAYGYDKVENSLRQSDVDCLENFDLCIQRLEPENNIQLIVKAYRKSTRILYIVGPTTAWFDKVVLPTLSENIKYLGPIYDREKLIRLRSTAKRYVHGHSVGGMNPVLIESLQFNHIPMLYLTPHNFEVYGSSAYYFYDEISLHKLLMSDIDCLPQDPRHTQDRFTWENVLDQYKKLI
jgi:glycosyltransferase involved in cell wall biosynthesis